MAVSKVDVEELASTGRTDVLKERGRRNINDAQLLKLVKNAIVGGHTKTVELFLTEWKAKDYNDYLAEAAGVGNTNIIMTITMFAPDDYAWNFDWALRDASVEGHKEAMEDLKSLGARDYDDAIWAAKARIKDMDKMRRLRDRAFDSKEQSAYSRTQDAIQLLTRWANGK
jgi:hypothetical protein